MSRSLPLTCTAVVVTPLPDAPPGRFEVVGRTGGKLHLRGQLSTGSRGWTLLASATSLRSTITVHVTAVEAAVEAVPDIEHHEYEVTIQVRRPGRYRVRVAHVYRMREQRAQSVAGPSFEGVLVMP